MSGLQGAHDDLVLTVAVPTNDPDWWIERNDRAGRLFKAVDEYSLVVLQKILMSRRLHGIGVYSEALQLTVVARSARRFCNMTPEQEKLGPLADAEKGYHDLGFPSNLLHWVPILRPKTVCISISRKSTGDSRSNWNIGGRVCRRIGSHQEPSILLSERTR